MENYKKWSIDWETIPKIANFIVFDDTDKVYWFEKQPDLIGSHWISENGKHGSLSGKYNGNWKESLTPVNVWIEGWGNIPKTFDIRTMDLTGHCYAWNIGNPKIVKKQATWNIKDQLVTMLSDNNFIGSWKNSRERRAK